MRARWLLPLLLLAAVARAASPVDGYQVLARLPHSTEHYTEGFLFLDGLFWEGTGLEGGSALYSSDPGTGAIRQSLPLAPQYFGEGIVNWGPNIYEWTWKSHTCFVYDRFSLRLLKQFPYEGEGWGMTRTARELITSDGTATLTFREPATFAPVHRLTVTDEGRPVPLLNELEFIPGAHGGEIWANVWHTDRIARISPTTGHVLRWVDLAGLYPAGERPNEEAVLNGIAYDSAHKRIYVTGKQWPAIFEIKVVPKAPRK